MLSKLNFKKILETTIKKCCHLKNKFHAKLLRVSKVNEKLPRDPHAEVMFSALDSNAVNVNN